MFHVPNQYRIHTGPYGSDDSVGNNGMFDLKVNSNKLRIIASDGDNWEHVSVSLAHRIPIWLEMCKVKRLFWDQEDCVLQFHPPESDYINCHPRTLHLWRKFATNDYCERPPTYMIGPPLYKSGSV